MKIKSETNPVQKKNSGIWQEEAYLATVLGQLISGRPELL